MKKIIFYILSLLFVVLMVSCELFSNPLYKVSRDVSGMVGSLSSGDLVRDMDKLATDPNKTADVLNELGSRDQGQISALSKEEKEKLLEAGIGAILPTSKLGDTVGTLVSSNGGTDFNKVMETLTSGTPAVNTKALETALSDSDVLKTTNVETLAMSAASLIVATVKNETGDGDIDSKMGEFTKAVEEATKDGDGKLDENKFKEELKKQGFGESSISSLTTAVNTTNVLLGTAGDGQPNRKDDMDGLNFGGQSLGDLLDQMTGKK